MASAAYTEAWLPGPAATQFYTRTYLPPAGTAPRAVVVAVHGFAEHIGRYAHFHPRVAARGIAVFAFDQRGFGLTGLDTTGKRSRDSAYGKTSWREQMGDVAWALGHAGTAFAGVPVFLYGHSMGGAEVLGFAMQGDKYKAAVDSLSGVIATSPLIRQTTPAPKALKWVGGKLSVIMPNMLIPAEVKAEQLSHDAEVNAAYLKDPLVKQSGSLKGINDMLNHGEALLKEGVSRWPKTLPFIIIHGTEDKVTDFKASQIFHDKVTATTKKISLYQGGYHELHNEPDGVKEKLADEIVSFIEEHANIGSAQAEAPPAPEQVIEEPKPAEPEDLITTEERTGAAGAGATKAKM
ncbi:hypothetical protein HYPSUDRAFT_61643 [Hypholoma sublateritium FD-334 SS-4]|uniref:Serine aminopeptidase S33 domain-containing protein n=1 Tax=Hypholoma sublateritium (strain FD-334 SS-4) TaxID=945553 RepID=A0A0D2PK88_HYPSF|nr:hypothetical protein HYPSUDRAFT_61643 [Hypholoma sublateritium FD-334 SS-4]